MELENSQNNALAKLPMLKLGEYEMWEIRIKQYFQIQDYALWEVIENGNSWVPIPVTAPESGPSTALKMTVPSTTEEKICKKNDVKARSLLLMALPNEHQLTFNQYADAQSMLQKLVSRLAILGVDTPPEDLNVKFLRSLPSEWDTHVNLHSIHYPVNSTNTINTVNTGVSTGNTKVNTASTETSTASFSDATVYAFLSTQPQGSQLVHEDLEQIHDDDLEEMDLKWNMALLSMRARKFYQRTGRKIIIDGSSTAGYDKSKVECFNCHKMGHFARECRAPRNGAGFDWSDMAEDEIQANMALMAYTDSEVTDKSKRGFGYNAVPSPHPLILNRPTPLDLSYSGLEEFQQLGVNEYGTRDSSLKPTTVCDRESDNSKENSKRSKKTRENTDAPIIEDWVSDDEEEVEPIPKVEKKTAIPTATKKESVETVKPSSRTVRSVNTARPFNTARTVNTFRPYNTAHPKSIVPCARPKTHFQIQAQSTFMGLLVLFQRPFYKNTTLTKRSNIQNINTGKQTVNTVRPNVNTVRARGFNVSNSQLNEKGFVDSGCSRHMSGNIAHLLDFKEFDGGYVTFGGGANGGRITGKQHRASLRPKAFSPITTALFVLAYGSDETSEILKNFIKEIENLVDKKVKIIRSDNGTEFKNHVMDEFCREKGIKREYSVARTPQQNGVAERKNRTLIEKLLEQLLADSKGIKPAIGFMKPFGCHVTILNTLDKLGKFDGKSDEVFRILVLISTSIMLPVHQLILVVREFSTAAPEVNTATTLKDDGTNFLQLRHTMEDQEIELGNILPSYEVSSNSS
ncbi:putative ribonuclease H-like domain-containing protein [Tanacetum coccineum]|uniref:Ribonuclease H-like domain-containing protein n=1 Tax=Tanacetum coccineum TaxID=301880 RepID=A0ABQ4Y094_9ASTR